MEYSLHRRLKQMYAGEEEAVEQRLSDYRIDAIVNGELIEIQHAGLSSIRDKIAKLVQKHRVRVVKPLVARKVLVRLDSKGGAEVSRRLSPKQQTWLDLFEELVYFTRVFPHPNLTLETVLVHVEEIRYPGHGKRRRWRRDDFQVADQRLVEAAETRTYRTAADLHSLLPAGLPASFHTGQLAEGLGVRRHVAQRIAYCLRQTGAASLCGKAGNALLYELTAPAPPPRKKGG